MKLSVIFILSIFLVFSCKSNSTAQTKGNGKVVSTEMNIADYSQIVSTGSCEIIYEQKMSSKPYLRYEIDQNLLKNVDIKVRGNKLLIGTKGSFSSMTKFKVYTNSRGLSNVKLTGSSQMVIKQRLNSPDLDISISGSGKVKADKLKCSKVNVALSGSGNVTLSGDTYYKSIKVSGSGNVDALGLKATQGMCKISGSGTAKIYVTDDLESRISGSGTIICKGKPARVDNKVSGSGRLKMQ